MQITILTGNKKSADANFEQYISDYSYELINRGHNVWRHNLREMDISFCTGCWTCWWKTPGRCAFKDDMEKIYYDCVASDLAVLAAPLVAGFPSVELKKTQDRLIPLLISYMEIAKGEIHHRKRYDRYPTLGLIVGKEADTDQDDLRIVSDIYQRFAINFKTELKFCTTTEVTPKEAANEVSDI